MGDLTALQAAVTANTKAVSDISAKVATLEATVGSTLDQTGIDAATAQIVLNNTTLENLVTPPSTVAVTPPSS